MSFFDWLIIYLTCGAPLGVLYFFQNRKEQKGIRLWLKTFLTFIFWLPFGLRLLVNKARKYSFDGKELFPRTAKPETEIFLWRRQLEVNLLENDSQISIFEFREVFDRYVGLTLAGDSGDNKIPETKKELFRIGNNGNVEIGAICLNRRNLNRLRFHQIQARQDFFQIIKRLMKLAPDKRNFVKSAADFFRFLNDAEAQAALDEALFDNLPDENDFAVARSEKQIWKTETRRLPAAQPTALYLQTLKTRANSSVKD
jgi:hypothetical protein